jgi:iron complex transport system substrate-binding protein
MCVLADTKCCGQLQIPWLSALALKVYLSPNNSVVELDDDVASRWGPRTVDFVKAIGRLNGYREIVDSK